METQVMTITPKKAVAFLGKNDRNRNIEDKKVSSYAADMKHGKWLLTHQGIAFYDDGTLMDGQHRLKAIIRSDTTVRMMVTTGIQKPAFGQTPMDVIDRQKARSIGNQLQIEHGIKQAYKKANIISNIASVCYPKLDGTSKITFHQALSVYRMFESQIEEVFDSAKGKMRGITFSQPPSAVAFLWESHPELEEFLLKFYTGENCAHGDPALTLRNMFLTRTFERLGKSRLRVMNICFIAIHAFLRGKKLSRISRSEYATEYFLKDQKHKVKKVRSIFE